MKKKLIPIFVILILIVLSVVWRFGFLSTKTEEIKFNNTIRRYRIHLPSGYNPEAIYPLVFVIHGLDGTPRSIEVITDFSRKADKEKFITIYPEGSKPAVFSPLSWNSGFCCNYAYEANIDDTGYLMFLIDYISGAYSVDKGKVYLVGFSNGGMLAYKTALEYPQKITAVAAVGSAVGGKAEEEEDYSFLPKSELSVPVIIFHGRNDQTIPYEGGLTPQKDYEFTGAYDSVNFWLENNECSKHPSEILKPGGYIKEDYRECKDGSSVLFFTYNGGHHWPGWTTRAYKNMYRGNLSATNLIWEYFSNH